LKHQLEHHEYGGGYGHVIDIELGCVPSRRVDILPSIFALAFFMLYGQWARWIEFCISQSFLRGCGGWYNEAGVKGVEGVELTEESESHVESYATSSCFDPGEAQYNARVEA
jgi:hypothetical protein